ncbi:MAG: RHS repeat-associated core domain-containing protein [Acutalibacteraceae bacterium]
MHTDLVNNVKWQYQYDLGGNVISVNGNNGTSFNYTYGTDGNLRTDVVKVGDTSKGTTYNYTQTGILEKIAYGNASNLNYEYDGFKITSKAYISKSNAELLSTVYTYLAAANEGETTDIVGSMTNSGNNWSQTLNYTYDANGNIETVSEGTEQKAKYYYDNLNQLIREDNAWLGKTIAYTYDDGGNIQLVEEYTLTSGALDGLTATNSYSYLYGDSNWKDKLTSYNGNTITYDQIGNPISYYNGNSFVWEDGRQLAGIETSSGDGIFYLYNSDGIRTFKMVGTTVTNYTLEGDKVVHETNGTDEFWYYYNEGGNLVSFELNGTSYYYVKNLQGDIIAITDDSGNKVVEYTYDSWGKLISTTGTLASTVGVKNPYRYRGYRYDVETGFYYLQSRYYDPEIGRFINADSYVDTGDTVLSTNMFAYCENNAVNKVDENGNMSVAVAAASFSAHYGICLKGAVLLAKLTPYLMTIAPYLVGAVALVAAAYLAYVGVRYAYLHRTKTLSDTKAKTPPSESKVYRLAYIGRNGNLIMASARMTFSQAVAALYGSAIVNSLQRNHKKVWGIYTRTKAYAKKVSFDF